MPLSPTDEDIRRIVLECFDKPDSLDDFDSITDCAEEACKRVRQIAGGNPDAA